MYNPFNNTFHDQSSEFYGQYDPSGLSPLLMAQSLGADFDPIHDGVVLENANVSTSTGSGCTGSSYIGSPGSPLSCTSSHTPHGTMTLLQRSLSSHSLHKEGFNQPILTAAGCPDLDMDSVRRVYSASDLDESVNMLRHQAHHYHHGGSPLANESTSAILEGMTAKPCRYSPEEKKEKIEKYRSKRSQRNFNKKIQYACRKTLADSRPRVRGRFARNDEFERPAYSDIDWTQVAGEEEEENGDNWIHLLDSISSM